MNVWLRMVRWHNLLIIAITQAILWFVLWAPMLSLAGLRSTFDPFHVLLLIFDTVLLGASSYLINDLIDVDIDRINRPERPLVSGAISISIAWQIYIGLSILGAIIALYLAWYIQDLGQLWLYPTAWFGLFAYSRWWKRKPLIGNLVVAFFCAFVPAILWYAERAAQVRLNQDTTTVYGNWATSLWIGYIFFAFVSTLFRELVKDLEDEEGDRSAYCRTLPVVWGMTKTNRLVFAISILWMAAQAIASQYLWTHDRIATAWLMGPLLIPIIGLAGGMVLFAKYKTTYSEVSQLAKYLMMSGLLILLVDVGSLHWTNLPWSTLAAWWTYLAWHSLLATNAVKSWIPMKYYRIFYNLLALVGLAMLILPMIPAIMINRFELSFFLGLFFMVVGFGIMKWAFSSYDTKEFLGLRQTSISEQLSVSGSNQWVRHPLYLGILFFVIGLGIAFPFWEMWAACMAIITYLPIGIHLEERKLIEIFGESYLTYKKNVKALIPGIL